MSDIDSTNVKYITNRDEEAGQAIDNHSKDGASKGSDITEGQDAVPEKQVISESSKSLTPVISGENTVDFNSKNIPAVVKKKELIRPLFSRSSTTDKLSKPQAKKSMIVETETLDVSNAPSVTLPMRSATNVLSNTDILSNNSGLANNLSSLRSKKSTLFTDQGSQVQQSMTSSNANDDNDNISINGSIRNYNKNLNPTENHLHIAKKGATKADLFAAKIANAVGDVSDSDSEETFVYESAPDALNSTNTIPNKTSAGTLGKSSLALKKLTQRNVSMPVTSSTHPYPQAAIPHIALPHEDTKVQTSQQPETENESDTPSSNNATLQPSQINQIGEQQDHSQGSQQKYSTEQALSQAQTFQTLQDTHSINSTKQGNESQNTNIVGNIKPRVFTKYKGEASSRKPSTVSLIQAKTPNPNQLRTTTSKLFDVRGSNLRRYSGVPDDINIEDYIDQYDEENELGLDDYSDTYDYDDYEEEDELTPLNVSNANNNLRNKMSKHYISKKSNFRSTDSGDTSQDFGNTKDEVLSIGSNTKNGRIKRHKSRSQQQQLQPPYSPHNFHNRRKNTRLQSFRNFIYFFVLVFLLLSFGFIAGFLLATTKDLQDVSITSVNNVVASYDELIFDLDVEAFNPGFVSVKVSDIELDIFARTSYLKDRSFVTPAFEVEAFIDVQTVLLGTVLKFETPLEFDSGFFNRNHSYARGEVKLLHPGQNTTDTGENKGSPTDSGNNKLQNDSDKWRTILTKPFELIIKGRFKYDLPFLHSERSVAVTKSIAINPGDDLTFR